MKKIFFLILSFQFILNAHTVLLNSMDNENGTMEIEGKFSTGATTQGATLKLLSLQSEKVLFEDRIPSSGYLTMNIPKEPYMIILDCGPGHIIKKEGTIVPKGGFSKKVKYSKPINIAKYTTLSLSIGFILLSLLIHISRIKKMAIF